MTFDDFLKTRNEMWTIHDHTLVNPSDLAIGDTCTCVYTPSGARLWHYVTFTIVRDSDGVRGFWQDKTVDMSEDDVKRFYERYIAME